MELELKSPELELELELKPPELELELIFWRFAGVGIGVGVETSGVGVGVDILEIGRSWSWSWNLWSWSWSWYYGVDPNPDKKVYQFTCLLFGLATSPREFTKLLRPVVSLLRQQGVKLHVYLDDWLIRADTPEQVQLHAQTTIRVLQFLGCIINCKKSDLTPSQDFQFIGMQFNTRRFTVAPLPKMRLKAQSVHQHWMTDPNITARDLHRLLGMLVFMASLVRRGWLRLRFGPMVGRHSMVPEDRELVRPDSSSTVGSVRDGMVVISSSPARSTPRHQGDGSNSLHGCVQFELGSPVRLTLDTRTVVSISTIVAHKRSNDAGRQLRCERLPTSSEVPGGSIHVRQRSDCRLHQERGGTRSHTLMQLTIRLLKWCDRKAITLVPVHLPGVHNIQADSLSRVGQTLTTEWTMAMESLQTVFAKWGEPWIDLFATFANRRLIKFISPYPDPRAKWTDAMSMPWDYGRGLLYAFPPFKMVPQVLQKIAQSPGVKVILIAQLQPAASWFPELRNLSQEDPIPLFIEGQDLLTQDVWRGDGVTETRHFRPSNLHAWKLSGPSWERRVIPGKLPTWCQGAFGNLHSMCTNPIGQDSWRSVGRKDGTCFESEVIISAPTWCTSSGTDFSHWRYHIARLWHLCYVIGCTIRQPTRTSSYWSELSGWNVRCNAESCLSGTFIWFYYHYWDRRLHPTVRKTGNPRMTSFP